jgi:hypothetical protein
MDFISIGLEIFVVKDVKGRAITGTKGNQPHMEVLLDTKVLVTRVTWETFHLPNVRLSIF